MCELAKVNQMRCVNTLINLMISRIDMSQTMAEYSITFYFRLKYFVALPTMERKRMKVSKTILRLFVANKTEKKCEH
jgi:hypothetical protein